MAGREGRREVEDASRSCGDPLRAARNLREILGTSCLPLGSRLGLWEAGPGRARIPTHLGNKPQI